jgi:hypothetical protein
VISYAQNLSEAFIRQFVDRVNWKLISEKQNLSEAFIREFADKVNWEEISKEQTLSKSFIQEFRNHLNMCKNLKWCIDNANAIQTLELCDNLPTDITSVIVTYL